MTVARFRFLLAVLLLALPLGCAPRATPAPGAEQVAPAAEVVAPAFTLLHARLERYDPPGTGASARWRARLLVINPNPYPLRLRPFDYQLLAAGVVAGQGRSAASSLVPPRDSAEFELELELELSGQPELLREVAAAFAGTAMPFRLEAALEVEGAGGGWRFAANELLRGAARAADALEPPLLSYQPLDSSAFLLESSLPVVRVVVRAENPGVVGYLVYASDLQLLLDGHSLAFGDLRPSPLPAGASSRLELLFYPDAERLSEAGGRVLEEVLAGREAVVELRGDVTLDVFGVGSFPVPPGWTLTGPLGSR